MSENDPERLVVVTSTPEGVAPLTRGEQSMIQQEPGSVEQAAVVGHSFPDLMPQNPARVEFEQAKRAFADSNARDTYEHAARACELEPNYLPAHLYLELGMNLLWRFDPRRSIDECRLSIRLGEDLIAGRVPAPVTEWPIEEDQIIALLDMAHYNLSDRLMRVGQYREALDHLLQSSAQPKSVEAKMKRRLKEASLLYRLGDNDACRIKLKQAKALDRELFYLLSDRMASDGHAGVDQPL